MVASVPLASNASAGTALTALIPKVASAPMADIVLSPNRAKLPIPKP